MSQIIGAGTTEATIWDRARSLVFMSEADVEQWLVLPLLEALGYLSTDVRSKPPIIFQEGRSGRKPEADYLVYKGPLHNREMSLIVVEAKKPGEPLGYALAQAESYAFNARAPFLLLTDGIELEIWQLQPTKCSEKTFSCKVVDLLVHRGRIESLIGKDAAIAHCRRLDIKSLPSPAGMFADYEQAELYRVGRLESIARTLKLSDDRTIAADILLDQEKSGAVVFGPSGFGKSTLLAALHKAELARRLMAAKGALSVEIQLPDLVASGLTLRGYALERIRAHSSAVTEATLIDQMREDGLLFLADRLERVPSGRRDALDADIRTVMRDYPTCRIILFDRVDAGALFGLPSYQLAELTWDEQRALAELLLPREKAMTLLQLPPSLAALAPHPLLLTRILTHYAAKRSFPHKLSELFETWLDQLLDRKGKTPSAFARLRVALEAIAERTAITPVPVADALILIAGKDPGDAALDELAGCGAIQCRETVEVQHEALADYLRAGRLLTGSDSQIVAGIAKVPVVEGSLLPALLVEAAPTPKIQRAVWARVLRFGLATYVEAQRYRADFSDLYRQADASERSRMVATDVLDGITEPLHVFFPGLAETLVRSVTGAAASDFAIVGQLSVGDDMFDYALRPGGEGAERVQIGFPGVDEPRAGLNLSAWHLRIDAGRLIGFRRLREEIDRLVKRRWLKGGPMFANERLIARLRCLEEEYGFPLGGVDAFDEIERRLEPHRGEFAGIGMFSKASFWIDELFSDIATLRAVGAESVDRWWLHYPALSLQDLEGAEALTNEHWRRSQLIYAELVANSFPTISDELRFFTAMPVRYAVTMTPSAYRGITSFASWLPVATWAEAGADVRFAEKPPGFEERTRFPAAAQVFAQLGRKGATFLSMEMGPVPDFTGEGFGGFDGETSTLRAAIKMLDTDLERIMRRGLFKEPTF